ncbi:flavin reductase [Caballeronia sp. LZ025]|nr:flavin reductase [Caballeronia grimmiae]MDR5733380.1 flavin reductase [Caballeronia sp. LZ025]
MTGVTIVTTATDDGKPRGFTANSFSSVSLDLALLLVSIAKTSSNYKAFSSTGHFAINILAEGQKDLSNTFARPSDDRFANVHWQMSGNGNPLLGGVSAWFDCTTHHIVDAGDHAVIIGKVEAFRSAGYAGLGYYRGGYFTPAKVSAEVIAGPSVIVSAIIARDDKVLLVRRPNDTWGLPSREMGKEGADKTLAALFREISQRHRRALSTRCTTTRKPGTSTLRSCAARRMIPPPRASSSISTISERSRYRTVRLQACSIATARKVNWGTTACIWATIAAAPSARSIREESYHGDAL